MSKSVATIITLLLVLLIGGGFYIFLQTYEKKQRTIHTGFLGEARTNPLYASRLFLKRMGIPSETKDSVQSLTGFPGTDTVLLIKSRRTNLSPRRTRELLQWVESGGHLIALATHNWKYHRVNGAENEDSITASKDDAGKLSPDPLQRALGVKTGPKIYLADLPKSERQIIEQHQAKNKDKDDAEYEEVSFDLRLKGVDKSLKMTNRWYNPLIISDAAISQSEVVKLRSDNLMLRQQVGNGMVTLLADMEFLNNKQLEQADHAEIFWHLIHGLHKPINQPAAVWLIHSDKIPPLWRLLWQNAWMLILSLLVLFIAWLLYSTRRFGPMIPKAEGDRRSLSEHISSSGSYYWKRDKKERLLDSSRHATLDRIARIYPGWSHMSKEAQIELLASEFQLQPTTLERMLYAADIKQPNEFIETIRQLELIRHGTSLNRTT